LLSRDLQTMDLLMKHLKNISDKEQIGRLYSAENAGPNKYFGYEDEIIPDLFRSGKRLDLYKTYIQFMQSITPQKDTDKIDNALKLFANLKKQISLPEMEDAKVKYFVMMEEAFMLFWQKDYDKAMGKYERISKNSPDSYIVHFRMGEIFFIKGKIVRSLAAFDKSDALLNIHSTSDHNNRYKIRIKLAYIYWLLGDDYTKFTLKMIREAEEIYIKHKDLFSKTDYHSLINASCWYDLANYSLIDDQKILDRIDEKLSELENLLKNPDASANMFDTVAWFHYNRYLKMGNRVDLDMAKRYCKQIEMRENSSTYRLSSSNLHMNHIQEILSIEPELGLKRPS